jgi:hypothetical protein
MENLQNIYQLLLFYSYYLTFTAGFIIEINRFFPDMLDCISRLLFSELIL